VERLGEVETLSRVFSPQVLSDGINKIVSPAQALWNQRQLVASLRERFKGLSAAVNSPRELALYQWAQLFAFALEFRPDLIIELGRLNGNSTCCFLEVSSRVNEGRTCRVLSLCLDDAWQRRTLPRLHRICSAKWFSSGDVRVADILDFDFSPVLAKAKRCLVFWDAHGFEVAEAVLGGLLPKLVDKNHVVIMHDMTDARVEHPDVEYAGARLWRGESAAGLYFRIGDIVSGVAQAISILDFAGRNRLPLHSASESIQMEIAREPGRMAALQTALGEEFFSLQAHWLWFSLNEVTGNLTFPAFARGQHRYLRGVTSWRNAWHPLRDLVIPPGTRRRWAYDALMRRVRRQT
jgi:hypothetical protein